jgi:hypothetical protein
MGKKISLLEIQMIFTEIIMPQLEIGMASEGNLQ